MQWPIKFSNLLTGVETSHVLHDVSIDLLFNALPLDSIIYYNYKAPTVSGYSGRKIIESNLYLDAAVKEWAALGNERRQAQITRLVWELRKHLASCIDLPADHVTTTSSMRTNMIGFMERAHSLAGDVPMGVQTLLDAECDVPMMLTTLLSECCDEDLELHLNVLQLLLVHGKERMTIDTSVVTCVLQRVEHLMTSKDRSTTSSIIKSTLPVAFDILALAATTSPEEGRRQLTSASSLQVLFSFLDFAQNKGDVLTSQIPIVISIIASALFQSSAQKHGSDFTVHSTTFGSLTQPIPFPTGLTGTTSIRIVDDLARTSSRLDVRANALWVHVTRFNSRKHEHTDPDVENNVRLMFATKKWARKQIDVPGLIVRYLSAEPEKKLTIEREDSGSIVGMNKRMKEDEGELYLEITLYVEILQKRRKVHLAEVAAASDAGGSAGGGRRRRGNPPPPRRSERFMKLLKLVRTHYYLVSLKNKAHI